MAYPKLSTLPPAPSKVARPESFVNESALFLQALPKVTQEVNAYTKYLNGKFPNKYNCGTLTDATLTTPTIPTFTVPSGSGIRYISAVDDFYLKVANLAGVLDTFGTWFDSLCVKQGEVSSDSSRTDIPVVSAAPTRNQTVADFNVTSNYFVSSLRSAASLTYSNINVALSEIQGTMALGGLTDATVDATIDCGLLTDTTITN